MELEYRFAGIDELDFLVRMRIRDLRMFSECAAGTKLEDAIRRFYEIKMKENACRTLLAYAGRELAATATLYFYDVLPSNENPSGRVGQITNVWVDEAFRRQGIATRMVERLMEEPGERPKWCASIPQNRHLACMRGWGFPLKRDIWFTI